MEQLAHNFKISIDFTEVATLRRRNMYVKLVIGVAE